MEIFTTVGYMFMHTQKLEKKVIDHNVLNTPTHPPPPTHTHTRTENTHASARTPTHAHAHTYKPHTHIYIVTLHLVFNIKNSSFFYVVSDCITEFKKKK